MYHIIDIWTARCFFVVVVVVVVVVLTFLAELLFRCVFRDYITYLYIYIKHTCTSTSFRLTHKAYTQLLYEKETNRRVTHYGHTHTHVQ